MANIADIPPPYNTVFSRASPDTEQLMVMHKGRACDVGEFFSMVDDIGNISTYGEVRDGFELWVNATLMSKNSGSTKTWSRWYENKSTKNLIQTIQHQKTRNRDSDTGYGLIDMSRIQLQTANEHMLCGTWVHIDVGTAFAKYLSPSFHAKWLSIAGKAISGNHAAVIDVLVETDRMAETQSVAYVTSQSIQNAPNYKRQITEDSDPCVAVTKRHRPTKGPTDVAFWITKKNGSNTAVEALALAEKAVVIAKQLAIMQNVEALAADTRAAETERKEAAKRETMRLAHEHAMVAQTLICRLDSRFYQIRAINEDMTDKARNGPCFYMVDCLNSTIMFGMTGNNMHIRYKKEKNRDVILGNVLVAVHATNKDEARAMEWTFKNLVNLYAPEIRMSKGREKIINSYEPFAKVMCKWNAWAKQQNCPTIKMP